ncbi:VWA-like domain-containing protein [Clostridium thermobutyricum]|uniref:vWA domain-containing protein n=1 Tax=Clostridium thermobutyricum TaxID=29372 RepID=UPI002943E70B|nr:VWA-like domain-containing protein [Clostridium thermobutyricum]
MSFDEKREDLYHKALILEEKKGEDSSFNKEFFDLVSDVVIYLMKGENSFFGSFMLKIKRKLSFSLTYPLGTIPFKGEYVMYFNPVLFLQCNKKEMGALFKHEIYHIMFSHYEREKELRNSFSKEAVNVALDVAINQFIKDLPMDAMRLDRAEKEYNVELKEDMPIEYYAKEIDKKIRKREKKEKKDVRSDEAKRNFDINTAHDVWESLDISSELSESIKDKTLNGIESEQAPESIRELMKNRGKAEVPWQSVLKKLIPSIEKGYKKTITRRDRRQSERLDLRGRLRDRIPEIIVAIDISGSISKDEFRKILVEVMKIADTRRAKVKIIECDNKIRRVYDIKSINEIKDRYDSLGSTAFSPVFEYIAENKLFNRPIIYFTDGVGEKNLSVKVNKKNIIWVLTGEDELSLEDGPYVIKKLSYEKKEKIDGAEGIRMYKEVMQDRNSTCL